jgi:hypothetical protein
MLYWEYWENSHIFRGIYFTRLCFKLNNMKYGMSELKLSWPVTLTGVPPAVISRPAKKYNIAQRNIKK